MQIGLGKNNVAVIGRATKDAEFKLVGEKQTPLAKFSLAVNDMGETPVYADCDAFGMALSGYARGIKKGDVVYAIGHIKTYTVKEQERKSLNCDWLNIISYGGKAEQEQPGLSGGFTVLSDDDGDLPFG